MQTEKTTLLFANGFSSEPDFEKFDTCRHKTGPLEYTMRNCCQQITGTGFVCAKFDIKGLVANHCKFCGGYERKED